ncbi:conserved hypothetical protein [Vibrio crassostreae]|uniref:DUF3892 domain-containing protein n=1 Tax=Vibrio crassostreae TaxID=246167 RepID=UPI001043B2B7|nr:DUF3892 domain-containing protein [Vibrio crassostreae]TCN77644.1 uncharacterized protein DUF3892 [Vibrio crassostreae]CAK2431157.1 conserved hypothetical protein [Vibrio crassostreae]CAK2486839.1 conserved hypothetical protein [Vibrio crassostreae]CAK2652838.1 conserved hypothetical protein [Vibrio crassostreae]CAK3113101.1 conserved hypothetical protein [Vibrio crassostreae]
MANNIKGNGDGENGENQTYTIPGRGVVDREQLVKEVEKGKHPNFHTVEVEGDKYVRANPDRSKGNNVDG